METCGTEEPYEGKPHVRTCGGIGRVIADSTRTLEVGAGQPMRQPHPMIDLEMMVTFGGKERTEYEFATLFSSAGLTLEKVTPITGSCFSAVEATPL